MYFLISRVIKGVFKCADMAVIHKSTAVIRLHDPKEQSNGNTVL